MSLSQIYCYSRLFSGFNMVSDIKVPYDTSKHKVTTLRSHPGINKFVERYIHVGTCDVTRPSRPIRSQEILTNQRAAFYSLGVW